MLISIVEKALNQRLLIGFMGGVLQVIVQLSVLIHANIVMIDVKILLVLLHVLDVIYGLLDV